MTNRLLYDGACPFCANVAKRRRVSEAVKLEIIDLRQRRDLYLAYAAAGFDGDHGFILDVQGKTYVGREAIVLLDSLSTPLRPFNVLVAALLRRPLLGRAIYPGLRAGRNLVLLITGVGSLANSD